MNLFKRTLATRGKIQENSIDKSNGFKFMYMRKGFSGATHTSYSNSWWKLFKMKLLKK